MNKRITTSVGIGLGAATVVFLLSTFIKWEIDPGLWSEDMRFGTTFTAGIFSFIAIMSYNIEQEHNDRRRN